MKIKLGFLIGCLVLNGSLYAMAGAAPLPFLDVVPKVVEKINLPENPAFKIHPAKQKVSPPSRFESLVKEYKIYRVINSSS